MKDYDLFVPLYYNDGRPVELPKFQALQQQLLDQFGGLTFFPQREAQADGGLPGALGAPLAGVEDSQDMGGCCRLDR